MLSGDVSFNSFLKMFFVICVGAVVFYYYRGVLQGVWRDRKKNERTLVLSISVVIILVFITAGILSDPFHRSQTEDTYEKLAEVESAYHSLEYFYQEEGHLPASLGEDIDFSKSVRHYPNNYPNNGYTDISYEIVSKTSFRLCVLLETLPKGTDIQHYPYARFEIEDVGENCFDFTL